MQKVNRDALVNFVLAVSLVVGQKRKGPVARSRYEACFQLLCCVSELVTSDRRHHHRHRHRHEDRDHHDRRHRHRREDGLALH
jgi:hypothetical protein